MAKRSYPQASSSESDSSSSSSKRHSGHKEGFYPALVVDYPFLLPVEDRDSSSDGKVIGVLCSLCIKHKTDQRNHAGTWTKKPCSCIRRDIIDRHSKSAMHREAVEKEVLLKQSARDGGIARAFEKRVTAQRNAVVGAMKVVYWLAKEEVAHTTKYESLLDLAINLGCTYLKELHVADNAHYRSRQAVGEFLQTLSIQIEEDSLKALASSPYFSLMTDESTDIAVVKQLVLVGRYILPTGDATTTFLALDDLPDGKAETIESAILKITKKKGLDVSRLRAFGSDGAPVMTGATSGVAKRLKDRFPTLISIHCVNHRLALAAAHAADDIHYLVRFKATVQTLFLFYQNSPVRLAGLHAIQEVLSDSVIKLKQAKDVRWLSHEAAISSILRTMPSLIMSLEREASERDEPAAIGLVRFVKTYYFVACCKMLSKILPHLNRLSLRFQCEDVDLSAIRPNLNATIKAIEQYRVSDVGAKQLIDGELSQFGIDVSQQKIEEFRDRVQTKYVDSLVRQLNLRFPEVDQLQALRIFDPSKLPKEQASIASYGNEDLKILCDRYCVGDQADVDEPTLKMEWDGFKFFMEQSFKEKSMNEVLKLLVGDKTISHLYPQLRKLAAVALILPISTAECERAFSTMIRIKTALSNRLITTNLDHLMRISINGPNSTDFDFSKAATAWGNQRQRRIKI